MHKKRVFLLGLFAAIIGGFGIFTAVSAADNNGEFSLLVTPSPLVSTVKPGETADLELKLRNTGVATENLSISTRAFSYEDDGTVRIDDTKPAEIDSWITFAQPKFTVGAGEWYTQKIKVVVPESAGFSYSFAFMISRTDQAGNLPVAGQKIQGSVGVFTLINVDRPGANRSLEVADVSTEHKLYEYLPANISVTFKNTGNTILQPYGNIFIERDGDTANQVATLPVNATNAYILPDTNRTLTTSWKDGFPVYETTKNDAGQDRTSLRWNLEQLTHFRIGKYKARVVAVYNDGTRDIPITKEITFWVFPWKAFLILIALIVAAIFLVRYLVKRRTDKAVRKALAAHESKS